MMDLSTTYLGFPLANPFVCSSSPLAQDRSQLRRMEDAGMAAVVLQSLFEEQIEQEALELHHALDHHAESYHEALSYFPDMKEYNLGPDGYLKYIEEAKQAVAMPIIGSLNGHTPGGWVRYARLMQQAGADALELNVYDIPSDPQVSGEAVESRVIDLVQAVRAEITLPLAVKLSPFYTAPAHLIQRLKQAGAQAVVLFNRFYQPDFDIDHLHVNHQLKLSHSDELLTRLHWVALLFGRVEIDLAVTGGVHTARDVLKCMMAGANVVMMASALIRHGVDHVSQLIEEILQWMFDHEYESIRQMQGSLSFRRAADPSVFERCNYMKLLRDAMQHRLM